MVQEGKLRFDDPISTYVAGVPAGDEITIGLLLKMRSGLFNFTNAPELARSLDDDPGKVWTAAEVLGMAFARPAGSSNVSQPMPSASTEGVTVTEELMWAGIEVREPARRGSVNAKPREPVNY